MADAFPNPWLTGEKGKGGKGPGRRKAKAKSGKGRGRGGWDDTPPDFSGLDTVRMAELDAQVMLFSAETSNELTFSPNLSPLERRFVHSVVERAGLHCHGVGTGAERVLVVTRNAPVAPDAPDPHQTVPVTRRMELESQLEALCKGTEPGARPRVGDTVCVNRVLGPDRTHLAGRRGKVVGVANVSVIGGTGGAATVFFEARDDVEQGQTLTLEFGDLSVVDAARPLDEGSLVFPTSLTGLERKAVHEIAESLGLVSASFGKLRERYITVFRASGEHTGRAASEKCSENQEDLSSDGLVLYSCVELDTDSRAALSGVPHPDTWSFLGQRMVICHGPLRKPRADIQKSANAALTEQISGLRAEEEVTMRVVKLGKNIRAVAVGVVGVPCAGRNAHVMVASAPGSTPWVGDSISEWVPYSGPPLLLRGRVTQCTDDPAWEITLPDPQ